MSHAYVIEGGHPLAGDVTCSGAAKNSGIKILAATLLACGKSVVRRIPDTLDVRAMSEVLRHLGAEVQRVGAALEVDVPAHLGTEAPYDFVRRMRASTAVLGPLLAREGRARVAMPGGDDLGPRPIDLHLSGLEKMGAEIRIVHGFIDATADGLRGAPIRLDYPSHGATENLMTAAVLAKGSTVIDNASREPEICDLAKLLEGMGARIDGAGTESIEIEGVDEVRPSDCTIMPDRLEAATFLFAAAAARGDVVVRDMVPEHLEIVLDKLEEAGCDIEVEDSSVRVRSMGRPHAVDISTLPYPGFPTDLQPLAVAMLSVSDGMSIVTENIYDARFGYVDELARMGADVRVEGRYAVVRGVRELTGAPVRAPDVSAGAALVVAGLAARGRTVLEDVVHIDRRYELLEGKLRALGARIERVPATATTLT